MEARSDTNRSSNLGIGAKDSSNHLVAGSLRSFPQDSWSLILVLEFCRVKRMIRGIFSFKISFLFYFTVG